MGGWRWWTGWPRCRPAAGLFRTVTKCGTGFSDADLAALPGRLAPLAAPHRPARVDARQEPDIWFEPGLVLEILSAELTPSPNYIRHTPSSRSGCTRSTNSRLSSNET